MGQVDQWVSHTKSSFDDNEGFVSIPYFFGSKPSVCMTQHTFSVYDQPKASVKVSFDPCVLYHFGIVGSNPDHR
jgi:hypothetical protein